MLGISNNEVASRQNSIPGAEVARSLQEFTLTLLSEHRPTFGKLPFKGEVVPV
jgi:hypothetical protein